MDQLKETAEAVVKRAKAKGVSAADVLIQQDDTFSVTVRMGEVETLKEAISRGLRLRIFVGKRTATSQTSDLSPAVVDRLPGKSVGSDARARRCLAPCRLVAADVCASRRPLDASG